MKNTPCGHHALLVCTFCVFEWAQQAASDARRELTYDELRLILEASILKSSYADAQQVLQVFDRDFTSLEREQMIANCIERGSHSLAAYTAKEAGRELSQSEIDQIVINGIKNDGDTKQLWNMLPQLSTEGINALIDICLIQALPNTACGLAQQIGRKLTEQEIQLTVEECRKQGFEFRIYQATDLRAA